jgi:transcriptional regulator with XRE-family HTH domain
VGASATTKEVFAQRLAQLREEHALTQAQLGKKVGVSGTCVWNWEGGNTFPRPATLARLAQALGTDVQHLTGRRGAAQESSPGAGQPLADVIMDARRTISAAAGVPISSVRVVLDVGD